MKGDSIDVVKDLLDRIDEVIEVSSGQPSLDSLLERISSIENSVERSTMEKADVQQELLKLKVQLEAKDLKIAELLSRSEELAIRVEAEVSARKIAEEEVKSSLVQLHQVQEELEHYFLLSRRQFKMLESSSRLQERTAILLAGANNLQ